MAQQALDVAKKEGRGRKPRRQSPLTNNSKGERIRSTKADHRAKRHRPTPYDLPAPCQLGISTQFRWLDSLVPGDVARLHHAPEHCLTNAVAGTPATRGLHGGDRVALGRSTKAGVGTPATREDGLGGLLRGRPRSTKAGVGTPATHPGERLGHRPERERSTKAGVGTPATPSIRSPSAHASQHAQRRPGLEPRRHASGHLRQTLRRGPLNEGRGWNPGDTGEAAHQIGAPDAAQRRPGLEPRRHVAG